MKICNRSHFEFLILSNPSVYEKIYDGEKKLKTDFAIAGDRLRIALEAFIQDIYEKVVKNHPNLDDIIKREYSKDTLDLYTKMKFFSDLSISEKYNLGIKCMTARKLTPDEVNKTYIRTCCGQKEIVNRDYSNKRSSYTTLDFVRSIGNTCHHVDLKKDTLAKNYENVRDGYMYFQEFLADYYGVNLTKETIFNEITIPINDFILNETSVPADSQRTYCISEYLARISESTNLTPDEASWAIIREYRYENIDRNFLSRGIDTQLKADSGITGIPEGMTKIDTISGPNKDGSEPKSPFYIIAYIFKREPFPLEKVLDRIGFKERFEICRQISGCFLNLHTGQTPIYHRLLNYNCIFLCDYTDKLGKWLPAIIKFDFSKITDGTAGTVLPRALYAIKKLNIKENKYIDSVWSNNEYNLNWEKVDIYSLGALFADILGGKILDKIDDLDLSAIPECKNSTELFNLIDDMTCSMPQMRPDISQVCAFFNSYRF